MLPPGGPAPHQGQTPVPFCHRPVKHLVCASVRPSIPWRTGSICTTNGNEPSEATRIFQQDVSLQGRKGPDETSLLPSSGVVRVSCPLRWAACGRGSSSGGEEEVSLGAPQLPPCLRRRLLSSAGKPPSGRGGAGGPGILRALLLRQRALQRGSAPRASLKVCQGQPLCQGQLGVRSLAPVKVGGASACNWALNRQGQGGSCEAPSRGDLSPCAPGAGWASADNREQD